MDSFKCLKLASAIFYQIFIFSPNDSPSKTMKSVFISSEKLFSSHDIQIFVFYPSLAHFADTKGQMEVE